MEEIEDNDIEKIKKYLEGCLEKTEDEFIGKIEQTEFLEDFLNV